MALYRVEIINDDGEDDWVEVEATSIGEARTKAAAMPQTESVTGTPALLRDTTRAARPTVGAGDAGEEEGGGGRSFQFVQPGGGMGDTGFIRLPLPGDPQTAPMPVPETGDFLGDTGFIRLPGIGAPGGTSFRDFTQTINPDLIDPRSSSYVPPPVTTAPPMVGTTGFADENIGPTIAPPAVAGFADAGSFAANVAPTGPVFVPPAAGGGFAGDDNFAANIVPTPPAVVPPAVVPPAVSGMANENPNWAANVGPVVGAGGEDKIVVQDPETGLPVITDRELFTMSPTAGYRRAFGNVFGPAVSGIGPIAEYLRRQQKNLTSAFRGSALRDFLQRSQAPALGPGEGGSYIAPDSVPGGATDFTISPFGTPALGGGGTTVGDLGGADAILAETGPIDLGAGAGGAASAAAGVAGMPAGYSFENYLRTRQGQPRGLPSAYEQALEDVNYFRGLGPGAVPSGASSIFAPKTVDEAGEAVNLLRSAQRGRYSPLVSGMFGQPSYEDVFGDYMLGVQDRSAQGQGPQNFFNFAAQRFGL